MNRIDAVTLRNWIEDGEELALLDAREEGEFGASWCASTTGAASPSGWPASSS